jgi:hypothetical protein
LNQYDKLVGIAWNWLARRGQNVRKLKRNARHKARRWVVERTHSWMNRFRRILVRWEKRADTYVALLHLVFALITWRACAEQTWSARSDFTGPAPRPLDVWARYAQVLLETNEFSFVD